VRTTLRLVAGRNTLFGAAAAASLVGREVPLTADDVELGDMRVVDARVVHGGHAVEVDVEIPPAAEQLMRFDAERVSFGSRDES
jgi:hypothetical protein